MCLHIYISKQYIENIVVTFISLLKIIIKDKNIAKHALTLIFLFKAQKVQVLLKRKGLITKKKNLIF